LEVGIDDLGARAIGDPGDEHSSSVDDLDGEPPRASLSH
jgi:hypothetical protein